MQLNFATNAEHRELYADDRILAGALAARGQPVTPLVWNETSPASLPPSSLVVIRSCWDYHLAGNAFARWLDELDEAGVRVVNPTGLVRWNLHKRYLLELASRGVPIVPTALVHRGQAPSLSGLLTAAGWKEAVVKPAVSLGAHETWRVAAAAISPEDRARFAALCESGDVLVQRFVPEIAEGEQSLVFLDGQFSHAVRKRPRAGDFRVQLDHGGTVTPEGPPDHILDAARRVVEALPGRALFARIDGVEVAGRLLLMEAECIDPLLYFRQAPDAAGRLAELLLAAGS